MDDLVAAVMAWATGPREERDPEPAPVITQNQSVKRAWDSVVDEFAEEKP